MCPLRLALYGHPDAGGYWERHCHTSFTRCGFVAVADWPSVYGLPRPACCCSYMWTLSKCLDLPNPYPTRGNASVRSSSSVILRLLECFSVAPNESSVTIDGVEGSFRVMEYDMEGFLQSCLDAFVESTGDQVHQTSPTPHLAQSQVSEQMRPKGSAETPLVPGRYASVAPRFLMKNPVRCASRPRRSSPSRDCSRVPSAVLAGRT